MGDSKWSALMSQALRKLTGTIRQLYSFLYQSIEREN
jgi:hypothetical protein